MSRGEGEGLSQRKYGSGCLGGKNRKLSEKMVWSGVEAAPVNPYLI
jgi:hypothetical protein